MQDAGSQGDTGADVLRMDPLFRNLSTLSGAAILAAVRRPTAEIGIESRRRAVAALAFAAPPGAVDALAAVATDPQEPIPIRSAALKSLGHHRGTRFEDALLLATHADDVQLRLDAIRSLGMVGGPTVLQRLAEHGDRSEPAPIERRLDFARTLVSARAGLGTHRPIGVERGEWTADDDIDGLDVIVEPLAAEEVSDCRRRLTTSDYGVRWAPTGLRLDCGGVRAIILLNQAVVDAVSLDRPMEPQLIAGAVTHCNDAAGTHCIDEILIATRDGDGYCIDVLRADGAPAYTGVATVGADGIEFDIAHVVDSTAPAAMIEGKLTPTDVRLRHGRTSARRRNRRSATVISAASEVGGTIRAGVDPRLTFRSSSGVETNADDPADPA